MTAKVASLTDKTEFTSPEDLRALDKAKCQCQCPTTELLKARVKEITEPRTLIKDREQGDRTTQETSSKEEQMCKIVRPSPAKCPTNRAVLATTSSEINAEIRTVITKAAKRSNTLARVPIIRINRDRQLLTSPLLLSCPSP